MLLAFYFEVIILQEVAKSTERPTDQASPNGVILKALVPYQNQESNNDTLLLSKLPT